MKIVNLLPKTIKRNYEDVENDEYYLDISFRSGLIAVGYKHVKYYNCDLLSISAETIDKAVKMVLTVIENRLKNEDNVELIYE